MGPLDFTNLTPLMDRTTGRPEISVALIDGPVLLGQPLAASAISATAIAIVFRGSLLSCKTRAPTSTANAEL